MTSFILDMVIMLSLFGVLFMVARSIPRIDDTELQMEEVGDSKLVDFLEEADERTRIFMEKTLRKVRIYILRMDNKVSDKIDSYKKGSKEEERDSLFDEEGKIRE